MAGQAKSAVFAKYSKAGTAQLTPRCLSGNESDMEVLSTPATRPAATLTDAKVALILAAETIFARDGIDGASLREIAAAAGQRNNYAVQYHFGSRETVMQAVFDYRMEQMEGRRAEMLAEARQSGMERNLRTVVEIIFLPQIELIDAQGDHSYAAFLNEYLLRYQGERFGDFGEQLSPHLEETLQLLREILGEMPEATAQRRLITACFMFLNILVSYTRGLRDEAQESLDDAIEDTIGQIVAAFEASVSSS